MKTFKNKGKVGTRESTTDAWLQYLDDLQRAGWQRGEQNCPSYNWWLMCDRKLESKHDYLERTKDW